MWTQECDKFEATTVEFGNHSKIIGRFTIIEDSSDIHH